MWLWEESSLITREKIGRGVVPRIFFCIFCVERIAGRTLALFSLTDVISTYSLSPIPVFLSI